MAIMFSINTLMLQDVMDVNPQSKETNIFFFSYIPDLQASQYRDELNLHSKYNHVFKKKKERKSFTYCTGGD